MKRLRLEDPRNGKVTYGPPFRDWPLGLEGSSLPFRILRLWMHGFMWGMSTADRLELLESSRGSSVTPFELETAIADLKLKGWEDFPQSYTEAPIRIVEG